MGRDGSVLMVVGVALVMRLAFVLGYPQMPPVADAAAYDQEASAWAFGHPGWESVPFSKGPIYPLFLGAIYRFVGHSYPAVRVVQALIGAFTVLLIYSLATLAFNQRVALIASALSAWYPPFISYTGWLLTETLSTCLLVAFVCCLLRAMKRPGMGWWTLAGFLGGILILHREEMLVIVVLSALVAWWSKVGGRRIAVLVCTAALTIAPWTIRNALVFHEFVLVSPGGGNQLWISTYEKGWGEWHPDDPRYQQLVAGLSPVQADRMLRRESVKNIARHPLTYLKLCVQRIPMFWLGGHSNTIVGLEQNLRSYLAQRHYLHVAIKVTMLAYNMGVIVLGFYGFCLASRIGLADRSDLALLAVPVVAKAVTHIFLFAALRYQVPIMSFLIVGAAVTLWHVRRVVRELIPA